METVPVRYAYRNKSAEVRECVTEPAASRASTNLTPLPRPMIEASCHCGAIRIEVALKPGFLIDCNCSICRRNGALWAIYAAEAVTVRARDGSMADYIWGARSIRTVHCRHCGCTTHWQSLGSAGTRRVGVNTRNIDPDQMRGIRIRAFDGAGTWEFTD
ncbi:GFA family protein [Tahibacter amnicola]|uniref:GFA family protein n=1 Tax=Tahibacter amnicola TaxID=2976241 RepID=A0ABY6BL71_9GAMM|nr:GFA family protein [Tahibacter amnicola]UXI70222.1 GFA family protein [Tahibacter amnicola]